MALFTEASLTVAYDVPTGETTPANAASAVLLHLSDGSAITVFDTLAGGLKLMAHLRTNRQWHCYGSDDVLVVSVSASKLLLLETTLVNQKLITSFLPVYIGGEIRWCSRQTSLTLSTTDALMSVGFCFKGSVPFANNFDLRTGGANMQVVDWYYVAAPPDLTTGSMLADPTPIQYDYTE